MTKKTIKCWLCKRLKEPSTWVSIGGTLGIYGTQIPAPYDVFAFSLAAVCAIIGVILPERRA